MSHPRRLEDQVVVVTGAARGIGLATAELAAREGAHVVLCDLDAQRVDSAVQGILQHGGRATGVSGDVSQRAQVRRSIEEVMDRHGRVDVLVNNAAINSYNLPEELPEDVWHREIDVCLSGTFFWAQGVAVASMIPRRRGAIVNVGSGAALAGLPRCASYVAAKHGVVGLTKALAVDWGQYDIRVNCVCPGLTFTELAKSFASRNPEMARQRELRIPLGRGAQPGDIARAIVFLGSAEAESISGVALSVDGGTLAMSSGYSAPRDGTSPPA
jgi:NAD(P)-dependent dehydrogenase (short-subunit alcohol dehydrogenase family)